MRFTRSAISFVSVCLLVAGTAIAETYTISDEPDQDVVAPEPEMVVDDVAGDACCAPCGPWQLYPRDCRGYEVGGWVQMGYHTEGANGVGTGGFNDYPNVVQLQQAWVYAEKVANTGGYGFDWGFRADYVYGTDGQDTQAFGSPGNIWDNSWDAGGFYGHAMPQLYGEVAYNNVKVRAGHFFTLLGYEKVAAPQNFFYSHSMAFNTLEPRTHTGVLAQYAVDCRTRVFGGWTAGFDTGFDQNGGDMFLGGLSYCLGDSMRVSYVAAMGDPGFFPTGTDSNAYLHTIVLDWDVTCRMKYVLQSDYLDYNPFSLNVAPFPALTVTQYLLYKVNCQWAVGGRFEWMGFDKVAPGNESNGDFYQVTVGANYRPNPNVVIRPEVRLDVFDPVYHVAGINDSTVFGIDAIVTF